jgi:hypothetical protein
MKGLRTHQNAQLILAIHRIVLYLAIVRAVGTTVDFVDAKYYIYG